MADAFIHKPDQRAQMCGTFTITYKEGSANSGTFTLPSKVARLWVLNSHTGGSQHYGTGHNVFLTPGGGEQYACDVWNHYEYIQLLNDGVTVSWRTTSDSNSSSSTTITYFGFEK